MQLINNEELKRLLLNNPKSTMSAMIDAMIHAKRIKENREDVDIDVDAIELSDLPECIFNGYCIENGRGIIVGVRCQILYTDTGDRSPCKADLAIETNVPGFWTVHKGVMIVFMEPIPGAKSDSRIHLADARYSREIEAISISAGPAPDVH
jgi:hypothetical protein